MGRSVSTIRLSVLHFRHFHFLWLTFLSWLLLIQASNTILCFQNYRHKKGFQEYSVTLKALLTMYLIFRRQRSLPPSIFQKSILKSLCFYIFFNSLYRSPHPIPKSMEPMIHAYSVLPVLYDINIEAMSVINARIVNSSQKFFLFISSP